MTRDISDELLNAFVDNQLDEVERALVASAINADPALGDRVLELRRMKEMVRRAFPDERPPQPERARQWRPSGRVLNAVAASLLLAVGAVGGWFAREPGGAMGLHGTHLLAQTPGYQKVVLHVDSADPATLDAVLDEADQLLSAPPGSGGVVQVEVVANDAGVELLRAGTSSHSSRIRQMQQAHKNIRFVACGEAIAKLRAEGRNIQLLPNVVVASSGVKEIVTRLGQGWLYLKV